MPIHRPIRSQLRARARAQSLLRFVAILALSLSVTACRARRGATVPDVQIDLQLPPPVVQEAPGVVTATLTDANGAPISGGDVVLRGDMTHAGMQPVITPMREVGHGRYQTDRFQFTMAGDWIVTVEATLPDGRRAERSFEVANVEAR